MNPDGLLQLLDVFRPALPEGRLGLAVTLLSFLGGGIYLNGTSASMLPPGTTCSRPTGFRPPFLFGCPTLSCGAPGSASGVESMESSEPSRSGSFLSIDMLSAIALQAGARGFQAEVTAAPPDHPASPPLFLHRTSTGGAASFSNGGW
jgi:hypothetical protein